MSRCRKNPHANKQRMPDKALREYLNDLAGRLGDSMRRVLPHDAAHPLTQHFYHSVQTPKSMQAVEDTIAQAYEAARRNLGAPACTRRDYLKATLLATTAGMLPFAASCRGSGSYRDSSDFAGPGPTDEAKVGLFKGRKREV